MQSKEDKHVLTDTEAFSVLDSLNNYFTGDEDVYVGGKHRTEVVADAMLREGLVELSHTAMQIHNTLKEAHRGNFRALDFLANGANVVEDFLKSAKGSRFQQAAQELMQPIRDVSKIFADHAIDWQQSIPVLADIKKETFPEDLSMTEKLGIWQRQQSHDVTP